MKSPIFLLKIIIYNVLICSIYRYVPLLTLHNLLNTIVSISSVAPLFDIFRNINVSRVRRNTSSTLNSI